MAIIGGVTDSFKAELFRRIHDFGSDTFKLALYSDGLGPDTTEYTSTNEVSGTGYSAGGQTLGATTIVQSGAVSYVDIPDASWPGASFSARGGLIYNSTRGNRSVMVLDFGLERAFTSSSNTVVFPVATANTALLRIGVPR